MGIKDKARVATYLDPDTKKKIEAIAEADCRPLSNLIEMLVKKHVQQNLHLLPLRQEK